MSVKSVSFGPIIEKIYEPEPLLRTREEKHYIISEICKRHHILLV